MIVDVAKSNIRTYVGIAAADKANDSRELYVYCQELLPFIQGELNATDMEAEVSTSAGDMQFNAQIKTSNSLLCQYRCTSGNNLLPPDVRKGEQVIVTCYSDTNTYYWDTAGVDTATRRTETHRIGVGGTLDNNTILDDTNCYYLEFDTRRHQHIKMTTSKANEEPFQYTIILSPERRELAVTDDMNNSFLIKSENNQVIITNKNSSFLNIEGDNITMSCKGNIILDAKEGTMNLHSAADMTFQTDANFIQEVAGNSTTTVQGNTQHTTNGTFAGKSAGAMSFSTDDAYSASSAADMSHSSQGNYSASSQGNCSISSQGSMSVMGQGDATFGSSASTTVSAGGGVTISAGGGLSMSFTGSGSCRCAGGSMTMQMARLSIVKG